MKNNLTNMTEGNLKKQMLAFALPLFIGHLFQQLYNTVDSLIVGNLLGSEALAAVTGTGSLVYLYVGFFMGFANGAGIVIARAVGEGFKEYIKKSVATTIWVGVFFSFVLTTFGVVFAPAVLRLMGTPEDVIGYSSAYLRVLFAGATGSVMYNTLTGILQAGGDSKDPLKYLILSSLLNIVLDYLFIGVFGMHVEGAALATIISQFFSMLLALIKLIRIDGEIRLDIHSLRPDIDVLRQIIRYGMPTALQSCVIDLSNILIQSYINSFGAKAMAGIGAYCKVEGFGFLPVTAFSMALSTFISQNIGAKKPDRVKAGMKFGMLTGVIMSQLIGLIVAVFAPFFISLFVQDPEVIAFGTGRARICGTFYCLVSFSHLASAVMRGIGKPAAPMAVMLICWCAVRVTVFETIGRIWHVVQLTYWIYPFTWMLSTIVIIAYAIHLNRKGELYGC